MPGDADEKDSTAEPSDAAADDDQKGADREADKTSVKEDVKPSKENYKTTPKREETVAKKVEEKRDRSGQTSTKKPEIPQMGADAATPATALLATSLASLVGAIITKRLGAGT